MPITIDPARRIQLVERLQHYFADEFDEELSSFRAGQVLEFAIAAVGPSIYNQAVQDARKYLQQRLDDLDGEIREPEGL